ncbi:MAG TPA: tetratricopeptide repeat protein [Candidatus Acidoferrum sp.]|nr:tetratricopeptide repeat protein [Candidatus Acidoferrum sp.]
MKAFLGPSASRLIVVLGIHLLAVPIFCWAQFGGVSPLTASEIQNGADKGITVYVSVREVTGIPLASNAIVRLSPLVGGQSIVNRTVDAATAVFNGIHSGEYEVEITAAGYDKTVERITVAGAADCTVYVYVPPVGSGKVGSKPSSGTVMTPDLQRELDKSLYAVKQGKYDEARKHLEKAIKMAPSNPDVQYLLGMIYYSEKNIPAARKQFESVVASYPTHQRSLILLGQIELDANENKQAAETLQKAVEAGAVNWQAHSLLAVAYARVGDYANAVVEADRTAELNKDKLASMKLLKAKILLMQGRNRDAQLAFEAYLRQFPNEPGASEARQYLVRIDDAAKSAMVPVSEPAAATASKGGPSETAGTARNSSDFEKPWAPPEVDAGVPPVAPGVGCDLNNVLEMTQKRILSQLADLEKFAATEHVEHQYIDPYGVPEPALSQDFDYIIFVHHSVAIPYYFDEYRNGAESLYSFPTGLVTRGLVSLGFMVVHPLYSQDFQFTCEGLGTWKGKPAWQIHFAQKPNVASRIRTWNYHNTNYPIPLKGRLWVSANTYSLVHLETALVKPNFELKLEREQMIVDYGPVDFLDGKRTLWLPWYAEIYFDMQGRRYHHRHTLTNYVLFDVDTQDRVKVPPPPKGDTQN